MDKYELIPQYDGAQSFYRKAQVLVSDSGIKELKSFDTIVAEIIPHESVNVFPNATAKYGFKKESDRKVISTYSPTTLRHIIEFLKQEGCTAINKAQIEKDYM